MDNLYLIGFMASGKSTLGAALAQATGREFVDTDKEIEKRAGMTVSDIFSRKGANEFRRRENEVLEDLVKRENLIVATGGGLPLTEGNMEKMLTSGVVVWLQASKPCTMERIRLQRGTRPLFAGKRDEEISAMIDEMMASREKVYTQAHLNFDSEHLENEKEIKQSVEKFLGMIKL